MKAEIFCFQILKQNKNFLALATLLLKKHIYKYQSIKVTPPPSLTPPIFFRTPSLRKRWKSIGSGVGIRPPPRKWGGGRGLTSIDWYIKTNKIDVKKCFFCLNFIWAISELTSNFKDFTYWIFFCPGKCWNLPFYKNCWYKFPKL